MGKRKVKTHRMKETRETKNNSREECNVRQRRKERNYLPVIQSRITSPLSCACRVRKQYRRGNITYLVFGMQCGSSYTEHSAGEPAEKVVMWEAGRVQAHVNTQLFVLNKKRTCFVTVMTLVAFLQAD
jgi:hypothetical protein